MFLSPLFHIRKYLRKKLEGKVYAGPYQGMTFPQAPGIDCYEAKLLGIYERELFHIITKLHHMDLQSLTVIGAAEGYHAIGLARLTGLTPLCFEEKDAAAQNLTQLAHENQVNFSLNKRFTTNTQIDQLPGLIFMDIEGAEDHILSKQRMTKWKQHHLMVEIHGSDILESLIQRSQGLFDPLWIECKPRTVDDYPFSIPLKNFLKRWWNVPVQEWRSDSIGWLILTPVS
jgi:hypothetical protein